MLNNVKFIFFHGDHSVCLPEPADRSSKEEKYSTDRVSLSSSWQPSITLMKQPMSVRSLLNRHKPPSPCDPNQAWSWERCICDKSTVWALFENCVNVWTAKKKSGGLVTWCFTPSQPLRLYQGKNWGIWAEKKIEEKQKHKKKENN